MVKQKSKVLFQNLLLLVSILLLSTGFAKATNYVFVAGKTDTIQNFDSGQITLKSYADQDEDPDAWELNSNITYQNSAFSLKLTGNSWKLQNIPGTQIDTGDVWQVSAYVASRAEIQGFGIKDSSNVLFYSFAGSEELNFDEWMPVYQGNFPEDQWNDFQLPIADDWLAEYGYLPEIQSIIFVNDKDATSQGIVYFDQIICITNNLPQAPKVSIEYSATAYTNSKVDVQFSCTVLDPDSESHDFLWDFGDGITSIEKDPQHSYTITDDHPYTVLLKVNDSTNMWGYASCKIELGAGSSSFPITMNFVGDIMLARKYEYPGGIIPTQGVEAIFEPTKSILGDAADITVANLECPLTTYWEPHPTKTIYFKGSPENVAGLVYAGIDVVTLANNHIMDYMYPGMLETQTVLKENNIIYSGAGANSYEAFLPAFYSKSGINFAFLAPSDRTGQYNNYQPYLDAGYNKPGFANLTRYNIKKQINEVKGISDFIIMEFHTGIEYSEAPNAKNASAIPFANDVSDEENYSPRDGTPSERGRSRRQYAIDNGADLVICHHPHIVQGVELYKGKLIAHSLGNFAFDMGYPETFHSYIVNTEVGETGFSKFWLTPIFIDEFIPKRAEGELGLYILDDMAERSRLLDTYLEVDRENGIAIVVMDTLNMLTYEVGNSVRLPLEETNGNWSTAPIALEKSGNISALTSISPEGTYSYRLGRQLVWFGNMEDEGCKLWYLNNADETYSDTAVFAGLRSVQHVRKAGDPSNLVTNFSSRLILRSDTMSYSLVGYIKTQNGEDVTIEIQYYEDRYGGILLGQENIGTEVSGDTPWAFYHKELSIPEGTEFFDIRLNSRVPAEGEALSWFDNVGVICWDSWLDFDPSQTIPAPNDYYFLQVKSSGHTGDVVVNYSETLPGELPVGLEPEKSILETAPVLFKTQPNPFKPANGHSRITFHLEEKENVILSVFDIKGQHIKTLVSDVLQPGIHHYSWGGTSDRNQAVKSGMYFYHLETSKVSQVKKCMLLR